MDTHRIWLEVTPESRPMKYRAAHGNRYNANALVFRYVTLQNKIHTSAVHSLMAQS